MTDLHREIYGANLKSDVLRLARSGSVRPFLRLGLVATYTDRQSTIADFGISGLLLGASLSYTP